MFYVIKNDNSLAKSMTIIYDVLHKYNNKKGRYLFMKEQRIRHKPQAKKLCPYKFVAQMILTKAVVDSQRLKRKGCLLELRSFIKQEKDWFSFLCEVAGEKSPDRIYNMIDSSLRAKGY